MQKVGKNLRYMYSISYVQKNSVITWT